MPDRERLRRTFRYRICPTVRQRLAIEAQLGFACQIYNAALEQRRYAWRGRNRSVSLYEQFRELTDVRAANMGPLCPPGNRFAALAPIARRCVICGSLSAGCPVGRRARIGGK